MMSMSSSSDSAPTSISTTSSEPRMLERRISNNRTDLSTDQQTNYLLSWFNEWSDLQKEDFVEVLASCVSSKYAHINGLSENMADLSCSERRERPPSLFQCQIRLFRGWVASWSDDQKNYLILRLKEIDRVFEKKYENYLEYGKESPERDYFEPGIPPELDLSLDKSAISGKEVGLDTISEAAENENEEEADCQKQIDSDAENAKPTEEVASETKEAVEEEKPDTCRDLPEKVIDDEPHDPVQEAVE